MSARSWKLRKTVYDYTNETAWDGPDLGDDESVEVVELAPVLDLIEAIHDGQSTEAINFLREHGRDA